MNERIEKLLEQCQIETYGVNGELLEFGFDAEKFAELIVQDAVNQCRQEWYDLNNALKVENEDPRSIGIRIGQKNGVLKCITRITDYFGIKNE